MNSSTKLVLLTTLLTLSVGLTAASPAYLSIDENNGEVWIDNAITYEIEIENTGPVPDVYSLSSTDSSSILLAGQEVELEPGESKVRTFQYNPDAQMEAGQYSFDIKAESRATGKIYSTEGIVNVNRNHKVSINVQDTATACLGEKATYEVQVTNGGTQKEIFQLTSPKGEFTRSKITLEDGETATLKLEVSSEEAIEPTFNVVAASTTSYAQAIDSVSFTSEVCYASEVLFSPESQRVAADTEAEYDVTVRNTGTKSDEFVLQASTGELENSEINIPAKSSKTTTLTVNPSELGQQTVEVTANSAVTSTGSATMTVYNGMDMNVALPQKTVQACENTVETNQVRVTNTGEAEETYSLQTNRGNLAEDEVTLGVNESTEVGLEFNSTEYQTGNVNYQVTATANSFDQPRKSVQGTFNVQNCWDLDIKVAPPGDRVNESKSVAYEVRVDNSGTKENTYELTYEGPSWIQIRDRENDDNQQDVTLAPGEVGVFDVFAAVPFQKKGKVTVKNIVVGEKGELKQSAPYKLAIGQDIEQAIESDRVNNSITGQFSKAASDLVKQVQGQNSLGRAGIAVILGLLLTGAILYWE